MVFEKHNDINLLIAFIDFFQPYKYILKNNKNFSENIFMKKFNISLTFTLWVFLFCKTKFKIFYFKIARLNMTSFLWTFY